jgi:hypothetical protein
MLGDCDWSEIQIPLAIILGYRIVDEKLIQKNELAPVRWESLTEFPDFSDIEKYKNKLLADLPNDEEGTGFFFVTNFITIIIKVLYYLY